MTTPTAGKRRVSAIDSQMPNNKPIVAYLVAPAQRGRLELEKMPTIDTFTSMWCALEKKFRPMVRAAIDYETVHECSIASNKPQSTIVGLLSTTVLVARAVYTGKLLKLPSDEARKQLIESLKNGTARNLPDIIHSIKTDRQHLRELAYHEQFDGDGKRGFLKEIITYGMQVKEIEPAAKTLTGAILRPAVYALADAKIALQAIQEMNRMDNEYGVDDKATSSMESQAQRIARIKEEMDAQAQQAVKQIDRDAIVKVPTNKELGLDAESD